jgi:hypothetical protein
MLVDVVSYPLNQDIELLRMGERTRRAYENHQLVAIALPGKRGGLSPYHRRGHAGQSRARRRLPNCRGRGHGVG